MKLYFAPGACSLSPHIALREAGISAEYERVDARTKLTESGREFLGINSRGAVPALELDDGQILTEGPAIVQYIADLAGGVDLAPPAGSFERYRLQEWLNYLGAELHKPFSLMFSPMATEESRRTQRATLEPVLEFLARSLAEKPFLMGTQFSVADGYLFTLLNWTIPTGIDLGLWPSLKEYHGRIVRRPAVRAALTREGLIG